MAKLTKKDTEKIQHLAQLELTSEEIDKFTPQLSAIVDLMNELNEVDTKDVKPTAKTSGQINIMRADEINALRCLPQDKPFEVPQILHINENN